MSGILAIETSTDACSVALVNGDDVLERCEVQPRRHNQILFALLGEVIDAADLRPEKVKALAFGQGPGSFTGLRIASSAIQGLSFASGIGVVGVSSLASQAQRALREGMVCPGDTILSLIDAKVGEVYAALYRCETDGPQHVAGPWACAPGDLAAMTDADDGDDGDDGDTLLELSAGGLHVIGDGAAFLDRFSAAMRACIVASHPGLTPRARDVAFLAAAQLQFNAPQQARDAQPVYVRDEISWKKLAEQGRTT